MKSHCLVMVILLLSPSLFTAQSEAAPRVQPLVPGIRIQQLPIRLPNIKVSPDREHREIVATGLRFVIGLEFNQHGDLFATDQEGDTWFPGGNPRDELLHIIPGRHYGFPFRHPKYLPDVIDEPAVVGFSPQHQSTCGFRFNLSGPTQAPFGPVHWKNNAIVTGFSRGKLWRVPLAKTRAGYVGKPIQSAR